MAIDLAMLILWIVLMDLNLTGVILHEYLGIGIILLIVIHNLVNLKWIAGVVSNFRKSPGKGKFILNLLLLALTVIIGVSGVMISADILPSISRSNVAVWLYIHKAASYGGMLLISVHIGLHWSMIAGALKKSFRIYGKSRLRKVLCASMSLLIMASGIYSSLKIGLVGKFIPETKNSSKEIKVYALTASVSADSQSAGTLSDYLGKLVCTACHRHCPLTAPQCARGEAQAQTATAEYESLKASAAAEDTSENSGTTGTTGTTDTAGAADSTSRTGAANSNAETGNTADTSGSSETLGTAAEDAEDQETSYPSIQSEDETANDETGFTDIIPIMGMVVCGTYYMVKLRKGNGI